MRITNKSGLPEAVYKALSHSSYSPGTSDYSVTTLLKPARMVQLQRRYWNELEEDVLDRVWSLFGSAAHTILEQHGSDESITEERMYLDVAGRKIGGQVDHYSGGVITDYKVTSAWTLVYGSRKDEWEEQLNVYAEIFRCNGYEVNALQIVCILRDWDKNKARQSKDYPQSPIQIIPLDLWKSSEAKSFILTKVVEHSEAEDKKDDFLPLCTAEDMWEQPSKYALMKEGRKSAVKVEDSAAALAEYCYANGLLAESDHVKPIAGYYFEVRHGRRTRCEDYCNCSAFCNVYKEYKEALSGKD